MPPLTIKRKIMLALAFIVLNGTLSMAAIYHSLLTVNSATSNLLTVMKPMHEAGFEMKAHITGMSLGVFNYLETGSPLYLDRINKSDQDFKRFKTQFDRYASSDPERAKSKVIHTQYAEYKELADTLLNHWGQQIALVNHTRDDLDLINSILNQKRLLAIKRNDPGKPAKTQLITSMEAGASMVRKNLGSFLSAPVGAKKAALRQLTQTEIDGFFVPLNGFSHLTHAPNESRQTQALFAAMNRVQRALKSITNEHADREASITQFLDLRHELNNILDEGIQLSTANEIGKSRQQAQAAFHRATTYLNILIPLFVLLTLAAGFYIYRTIIVPVHRLTRGTTMIGSGDFTHRIQLQGRDEFTDLGQRFNDMVGQLDQTTVSKRALEDSEERYRLLIDSVRDYAIFTLDNDTRITSWNSASERLLGFKADDIIGQPYNRIYVSDGTYDAIASHAITMATDNDQFEHDTQLSTQYGLRLDASVSLSALRDPVTGKRTGFSVIVRDMTERMRAEDDLRHLAHFDQLTGLPNRTLFSDRLQQAIDHAERSERLVGVVMLDLDRFKNVNDSLGHAHGDELLCAVAKSLTAALRKGDTVARLSGDEFALVLADMAHIDDASLVVRKIMESFETPLRIGARTMRITASIGITIYPFDDADVPKLLRDADSAMYAAKAAGRNTFAFYAAEMTERAIEALAIEQDFREALERDELKLYYQPIMNTQGELVGAEALSRWLHPEKGMIPPDKFIPLAEETGLIVPMGDWVIQTACAQLHAWRESGFPIEWLAVNVSYAQFNDKLVPRIVETLERYDLDPSLLVIEVTESMLMHNVELATQILTQLHEQGFTIAIDDFGTGYSSLNMLRHFPINKLKIDLSFVREIEESADSAAIVQAIIAMAQSLKLTTVAEGVETASQGSILNAMGCDEYQGYYFGKPIDADTFTQRHGPTSPYRNDAQTTHLA